MKHLKPGTLCESVFCPSLYHTTEDLKRYAWSGITPPKYPNCLPGETPVLYIRDREDIEEKTGIVNEVAEIIYKDKVVMVFKSYLMPLENTER